jgi:prepilin-type N-terminal cleavage/methylation domain-containing protein
MNASATFESHRPNAPDIPGLRGGFSLVEVIASMVIFAALVMGLLGATQMGLTMTIRSKHDMDRWAVVQRTADSLAAQPSVASGSLEVSGVEMEWAPQAGNPGLVTLVVRQTRGTGAGDVTDTLFLHLR